MVKVLMKGILVLVIYQLYIGIGYKFYFLSLNGVHLTLLLKLITIHNIYS